MSDFSIILTATGNLDQKLDQLNTKLGEMAKQGRRIGPAVDDGLRGTVEKIRQMQQEMHRFMTVGLLVYNGFRSAAEIWAGAHERAAARVNKANREAYDQAKKGYADQVSRREQNWENQGLATTLRLSGVQDGNAGAAIMGSLNTLQGPIGETIRRQLFPAIAKQIAAQRLSTGDTESALQTAAASLNQYGHVAGYGDAYADLAGAKGMAGRSDLGDRALALTMRRARLSGSEQEQLSKGLGNGEISVGADGMLGGSGDSAMIAKLVNSLGGLALRAASAGWDPKPGQGWDASHLGGMHVKASPGEAAAYRMGDEFRGALPIAPDAPKEAKDVPTTAGDWLAAAFSSPAVQQAIATAMTIGMLRAWGAMKARDAATSMAGGLPGRAGKGLLGTAGRFLGPAALVAGTVWAASDLAGSTDGMKDWRNPPEQGELDRRKALKIAQTVSQDDDTALRGRAATGDAEAQRIAPILEAILAEMKKGNAADWEKYPLAPLTEAQ